MRFGVYTALDQERKAHSAFARQRRLHFQGREAILIAIADYLENTDRRPLLLYGVSGSGKSAIMAQIAALSAARSRNAITVRRFIGVTPEASNGLTLLRSLCEEIGQRYGDVANITLDFNDVASLFQSRLLLAKPDRPLHLYVDALDQLNPLDQAASLAWLPTALPANCRIVLSAVEIPPALRNVRTVQVDALSLAEADAALTAWLQNERRVLQDWQRGKLLAYFERSGLPLYLRLAFEEARQWRSFDEGASCELREGLDGIIDLLFDRMSLGANHGKTLVGHGLAYLAASRYGLTEDEIIDVLTADDTVWNEFRGQARYDPPSRRLPVVVWARLFADLEAFLTERAAPEGTVISFYHRQLLDRVRTRFFIGDDTRGHEMLARLFGAQPTWLARSDDMPGERVVPERFRWFSRRRQSAPPRDVPNQRKLFEYPFQQAHAGGTMRAELEGTLADISFLEAKCLAGLQYDLLDDCDRALSVTRSGVIAAVREAIGSALPSINARPAYSLQSLFNRLVWAQDRWVALRRPLADAQERLCKRGPWLQYTSRIPSFSEGPFAYPLGLQSIVQAVSRSGSAIAVANFRGDIAVHRLATGEVIWRGTLRAKPVAGICLTEAATGVSFSKRAVGLE